MTRPTHDLDPLDQPLFGAMAIGKAMGIDERKAWHLLDKHLLPATKLGGQWVSTRRRLMARINGADGATVPVRKAAPPIHVAKSQKKKLRPRRQGA